MPTLYNPLASLNINFLISFVQLDTSSVETYISLNNLTFFFFLIESSTQPINVEFNFFLKPVKFVLIIKQLLIFFRLFSHKILDFA